MLCDSKRVSLSNFTERCIVFLTAQHSSAPFWPDPVPSGQTVQPVSHWLDWIELSHLYNVVSHAVDVHGSCMQSHMCLGRPHGVTDICALDLAPISISTPHLNCLHTGPNSDLPHLCTLDPCAWQDRPITSRFHLERISNLKHNFCCSTVQPCTSMWVLCIGVSRGSLTGVEHIRRRRTLFRAAASTREG